MRCVAAAVARVQRVRTLIPRVSARRQLVLLSDCENDHINAHECARRLDKLVVRARSVAVAAPRRTPRYGARRCTAPHAVR